MRQIGHGGRDLRGFVSIAARSSVTVMFHSFCLCTDRTAAFGGMQGNFVLQLELSQLPCRRREQICAVKACVLWRKGCLDSCFVLHWRFKVLRGVSLRESCQSCGRQRTCPIECGCGLSQSSFVGLVRNCRWWSSCTTSCRFPNATSCRFPSGGTFSCSL